MTLENIEKKNKSSNTHTRHTRPSCAPHDALHDAQQKAWDGQKEGGRPQRTLQGRKQEREDGGEILQQTRRVRHCTSGRKRSGLAIRDESVHEKHCI